MSELSDEELKADRKRAARVSLVMGGLALVIGSLICLAWLVVIKPWKLSPSAGTSAQQTDFTRR